MRNKSSQILVVSISIKTLKIWKRLMRFWQMEKEEEREEYNFFMLRSSNLLLGLLNLKVY